MLETIFFLVSIALPSLNLLSYFVLLHVILHLLPFDILNNYLLSESSLLGTLLVFFTAVSPVPSTVPGIC